MSSWSPDQALRRRFVFAVLRVAGAFRRLLTSSEQTYKLLFLPGFEGVRWRFGKWHAWMAFERARRVIHELGEHGGKERQGDDDDDHHDADDREPVLPEAAPEDLPWGPADDLCRDVKGEALDWLLREGAPEALPCPGDIPSLEAPPGAAR